RRLAATIQGRVISDGFHIPSSFHRGLDLMAQLPAQHRAAQGRSHPRLDGPASRRARPARRPRRRLQLDWLEDRVLLSVFGGFQIDGDLQASVPTNPPPANTYDWDTLKPQNSFPLPKIDTVQNDVFNSTADDQFGGGAKESDATFAIQTGSSPSKA